VTYDAVPFVPWDKFVKEWTWNQGEHLLVVGDTGQGKTTIQSRLLDKREFVVIFVTKTHDDTITREYRDRGYRIIEDWDDVPNEYDEVRKRVLPYKKLLLWPKPEKDLRITKAKQRVVFRKALNSIFLERGWTVVLDEEHYMVQSLKLGEEVETYHHQARSSKITVVDGIQRPAWVPVITYGSATHGFIAKVTNRDDMKRLSNLGGVDHKLLESVLADLPRHQYLVVNTRGDYSPFRTKVTL
jgi:hypothetical protein